MRKPEGYEESEVFDGNFSQLEPGGYICVIKDAKEDTTQTGKQCIRLCLDIAEGSQKDYYTKKFKGDKERRDDVKWGCVFTQISEGKSLPFFKGMISSINSSNTGYRFEDTFDEKTLRGKIVGGVFGREQFKKNDGSLGWYTKCFQLRSSDAIREGVPVPEDKYIDVNPYAEQIPPDEVPF